MQRRHLDHPWRGERSIVFSTGAQAKPELTVDAVSRRELQRIQDLFVGQDQSDRRV